jgi:iron complex transport system substrate-binding protein
MNGPSVTLPTRREILKGGGALVGGGLLAGCTGGSGSGDGANNSNNSGGGANDSEGSSGNATSGGGGNSYSVTMAPVGEVEFASIPKRWVAYAGGYADMGVALGLAEGLQSIGIPARYYTFFYDELPGVSVDEETLTTLYSDGINREVFFEIDADIHLIDPNWLVHEESYKLEQQDINRIAKRVAPFIGNLIFRRNDPWHDYRYYSMYEAFEKISHVFKQEKRYRQFKAFHDEYIGRLQQQLPPKAERPAVALLFPAGTEPEKFYTYRVSSQGTNKKHWHDLGVTDAFAGTGIEEINSSNNAAIDYETLLEIDPPVIALRGHVDQSRAEFENSVVAYMEEHPVASELTAVKTGRVIRGGPLYQGPVMNLFITERAAISLYPNRYNGELFDRQPVADIINGKF